MRPVPTSGWPKIARSRLAKRISHAKVNSLPPAAHPASYEGDAYDAALGEACRRVDPWRYAEAAPRLCRAVVSDKKIWVGALESHDLQTRVGLDLQHEIVELIVCPIVDGIDWGVAK